MHWETRKLVRLALCWFLLYCGVLEPNPQYLGGLPVCTQGTLTSSGQLSSPQLCSCSIVLLPAPFGWVLTQMNLPSHPSWLSIKLAFQILAFFFFQHWKMELVVCSQHQREKGGVFPHLFQLHISNSPLLPWLTCSPILAASQLQGVAAMTRRVQVLLVLHPLLPPLALLIPASSGRCHHWAPVGSRINATRMFMFKSFILSGN